MLPSTFVIWTLPPTPQKLHHFRPGGTPKERNATPILTSIVPPASLRIKRQWFTFDAEVPLHFECLDISPSRSSCPRADSRLRAFLNPIHDLRINFLTVLGPNPRHLWMWGLVTLEFLTRWFFCFLFFLLLFYVVNKDNSTCTVWCYVAMEYSTVQCWNGVEVHDSCRLRCVILSFRSP